jgi:L-iditol 2-dehydrogenase
VKAVLLYGPNNARVEEVSVPKIRSREILVEMKACGVCGTDIEKMAGNFLTPPKLGHEVTGRVDKIGANVKNIQVDDRVFVHHHVPCYTCYYCKHRNYTMCKEFNETNLDPCGFAEYFRVPESNVKKGAVYKLPDDITFETGTLMEPVACCIRGLKKSLVEVGENVLVIGAGPIGLIMINLLRCYFDAHFIISSEILKYRRQEAQSFGADYSINPNKENLCQRVKELTKGRGADLVIDAVGNSKTIGQGLDCTRKGGRLLLFGVPSKDELFSYDLGNLFINEKMIIPSYSTTEIELDTSLKFIEGNISIMSKLISHTFSLDDTIKAIQFAKTNSEALKVIVKR